MEEKGERGKGLYVGSTKLAGNLSAQYGYLAPSAVVLLILHASLGIKTIGPWQSHTPISSGNRQNYTYLKKSAFGWDENPRSGVDDNIVIRFLSFSLSMCFH